MIPLGKFEAHWIKFLALAQAICNRRCQFYFGRQFGSSLKRSFEKYKEHKYCEKKKEKK